MEPEEWTAVVDYSKETDEHSYPDPETSLNIVMHVCANCPPTSTLHPSPPGSLPAD